MNWRIPLADLDFGPEEAAAVQRVIESKWLTMGAVTQQFEEEFAAFTGAKHAISVANGTVALHLACLAAGIGPGDEVILPALTFVATAAAVVYCRGIPVFADICGEDDLTLSPEAVERCITERTRAIMVMHYGGYACDMAAISEIARKYNLVVLEDAAHAAGSSLDGKALGRFGLAGTFSFFSNKNLATGEGGMVVTDDDAAAEKMRRLRSHGMTTLTWDRHRGHAWSYDVVDLGYNYRTDEIHSALGIEQLHKLPGGNQRRRTIVRIYQEQLHARTPEINIPFLQHRGVSACHLFPVLLPPDVNRTDFMERLKADGIQTSIHYPPIHQFSQYRGTDNGTTHLAITEAVAAREVTLPLYAGLRDEDVEYVTSAVEKALVEIRSNTARK